MKAMYIYQLICEKEEEILSLHSKSDRLDKIIDIAKNAPLPADAVPEFSFLETMNMESGALIRLLERHKIGGKQIVVPHNKFSEEEVNNISNVYDFICELCNRGL